MCCDSWGRKESDTTEQLKCTAPYKLLVLVYHYRQHNWVFKIRIPMSKQYGSSREDILTLFSLPAAAKSLQSYPTLCNPIDGSPPGSSVHGIFQARVLEWVPSPSPSAFLFMYSNCHSRYIFFH